MLPTYYLLKHRWQNILLLGASYFFYGYWDYRFCSLLALSTVVDFFCAQRIQSSSEQSKKDFYLAISCCTNLGILGFFKYVNFFVSSFSETLQLFGLHVNSYSLNIILPVGISFYTFQTLAYTIDVYRGKIKPSYDFINFALYVSFFPQLVAGPIERGGRLLPQIEQKRTVSADQVRKGILLILIGMLRKVAIADIVDPTVCKVFNDPMAHSADQVFQAHIFFALQIYCDFAGYSDIARGTAKIFGFNLMRNFTQPYFSRSIGEFWTRWHISFTTWIRDYLYFSMGGSKKGSVRAQLNLLFAFIMIGLWHGADSSNVTLGILFFSYIFTERIIRGLWSKYGIKTPHRILDILVLSPICWVLVMIAVMMAWNVFRAPTFFEAGQMVSTLFVNPWHFTYAGWELFIYVVGLTLIIDLPQKRIRSPYLFLKLSPAMKSFLVTVSLFILVMAWNVNHIPFIYFQF